MHDQHAAAPAREREQRGAVERNQASEIENGRLDSIFHQLLRDAQGHVDVRAVRHDRDVGPFAPQRRLSEGKRSGRLVGQKLPDARVAVERDVLVVEDGVGVGDRGRKERARIGGRGRHDDLQARRPIEPRLGVLAVVRTRVTQPSPRHPHDHRDRPAPPVPDLRGVVDELVEAGRDKVVELDLADRALAGERRADADPQDPGLGEGRVQDPVSELGEQRLQQQEGIPVFAADVLAVDEDAGIGGERVANAEHHRFQKGLPLRVERRARLGPQQNVGNQPPARLGFQDLDPAARRLVREDASPGGFRRRPRGGDDLLRLFFDERLDLGLEPIEVAFREDPFGFQPRRVRGNGIALRPEIVEPAVRVAGVEKRRIVPGNRRLLAEVEHVVVVRVAADAHADELNQRRAFPRARPLDGPRERGRDAIRVGAVERDPGDAVSRGLLGEDAHGRLIGDRRRERGLVVLNAEDRGEFSRRAEVDRLVPFAERRASLADVGHADPARAVAGERHRHARDRERGDREWRRGRQDSRAEVADVEILALHRRPGFSHLRGKRLPHRLGVRPHRERRAEVADERRDDVAAPRPVPLAIRLAAAQPNGRRVDRLLAEGPEPLPLERCASVPDFAAREERLQPVVGRAREDHAAQDLDALLARERRFDRLAAQETVAGLEQLRLGLLHPHFDAHPGDRVPERLGGKVIDGAEQRLGHRAPQRFDGGLVAAGVGGGDRAEGLERGGERERKALRDERPEPGGEGKTRTDWRAGFDDPFHRARMLTRQDLEVPAPAESIDGEVPAIGRENEVCAEFFTESDEGRIRIVHGKVGVFLEELATPPERCVGRGNQERASGDEKIEARPSSTFHAPEQVRGLRQDGFGAHDRALPPLEESSAVVVESLGSVQERNQRSGVQEELTGHSSATRGCTFGDSPRGRVSRTRVNRSALGRGRSVARALQIRA